MESSCKINRRSLLIKAPALGAAVAASAAVAGQAKEKDNANAVFRVGCLNVGSYSHLASTWASLVHPRPEGGKLAFAGMQVTHCWDIEPARAKGFAKGFDCEAVKNFDDMLGKVDGIISGGYYNHPWNHILHEPYLEAGLPTLINRPFTNSLAKARKMVETAKKSGATILVPSALEHNNEIAKAKAFAATNKVACYSAVNSSEDYPTHGIHGVYMVFKAIVEAGNPVVSVSYRAADWYKNPGLLTYEHRDQEGRTFYGTLHQMGGGLGTIQIHTPEEASGRAFHLEMGAGYPFNKTEFWAPTIWAFEHMALTGQMSQSLEQILHKNNIFLAGWRSILENDGNRVKLDDVPEDWETPVELPNRPGEKTASLFKKKFG